MRHAHPGVCGSRLAATLRAFYWSCPDATAAAAQACRGWFRSLVPGAMAWVAWVPSRARTASCDPKVPSTSGTLPVSGTLGASLDGSSIRRWAGAPWTSATTAGGRHCTSPLQRATSGSPRLCLPPAPTCTRRTGSRVGPLSTARCTMAGCVWPFSSCATALCSTSTLLALALCARSRLAGLRAARIGLLLPRPRRATLRGRLHLSAALLPRSTLRGLRLCLSGLP